MKSVPNTNIETYRFNVCLVLLYIPFKISILETF